MLICIVLYSDRRDCALKYVCNGKTIAYQCVACVLVKLFALRCHFFCHFGNTYVSIFILCGVNKPNMSTAKHDCIFQHKLSIGNKSTAFSNVFFQFNDIKSLTNLFLSLNLCSSHFMSKEQRNTCGKYLFIHICTRNGFAASCCVIQS